ncbi:hypothetical protein PINS_up008021 [Pythium insidiosum]|nr:hypothetical protein PINS_up008021 [Pythium insidiosum]
MDALLHNEPLLTKSGAVVPLAQALSQKKVIGLYFSGHYCPPCRKFTPILAQVYEEIKDEHEDVEIVFVSSDKEVEKFDEYYQEMPWLALPWAKRDLQGRGSAREFGRHVQSRTLVFLQRQGRDRRAARAARFNREERPLTSTCRARPAPSRKVERPKSIGVLVELNCAMHELSIIIPFRVCLSR